MDSSLICSFILMYLQIYDVLPSSMHSNTLRLAFYYRTHHWSSRSFHTHKVEFSHHHFVRTLANIALILPLWLNEDIPPQQGCSYCLQFEKYNIFACLYNTVYGDILWVVSAICWTYWALHWRVECWLWPPHWNVFPQSMSLLLSAGMWGWARNGSKSCYIAWDHWRSASKTNSHITAWT